MRRKLLDAAVVVLVLLQLWQWWPSADEDMADPDDTLALFALIEATRDNQPTPLQYLESDFTIPHSALRIATSTASVTAAAINQNAASSTVLLVGVDDWGDAVFGAGVILTADGVIVTNEHLISDTTELYIVLPDRTTIIPVDTVLYRDVGQDLALLQAATDTVLTPITISPTDPVVGDAIFALGHPELFLYSLTDGIISGARTYTEEGGRFWQMTAPVNYGSSGGPILNAQGHLVGLVSWSLEYEQNIQNVEGLHFAIPAAEITRLFVE